MYSSYQSSSNTNPPHHIHKVAEEDNPEEGHQQDQLEDNPEEDPQEEEEAVAL
jgi:hypothetical protein